MIQIRPYQTRDIEALWRLFFNTVHQRNAQDYSQEQSVLCRGQVLNNDLMERDLV